ncbi:MAG: hypothetical protein ACOC5T_08115 [Elusimicrobiota bacterium]
MSHHKQSFHHVIPKSRGGKHTCSIPKNFHKSWHHIFENLTPKEICIFVRKLQNLMMSRNEITWDEINTLRNQIKEV